MEHSSNNLDETKELALTSRTSVSKNSPCYINPPDTSLNVDMHKKRYHSQKAAETVKSASTLANRNSSFALQKSKSSMAKESKEDKLKSKTRLKKKRKAFQIPPPPVVSPNSTTESNDSKRNPLPEIIPSNEEIILSDTPLIPLSDNGIQTMMEKILNKQKTDNNNSNSEETRTKEIASIKNYGDEEDADREQNIVRTMSGSCYLELYHK